MVNVLLKDGRIASIDYLKKSDKVEELLKFINTLIEENAYIRMDKKATLKEEKIWKKDQLKKFKEKTGFTLIAKIDGKIVGSSGAFCGVGKESENVSLGIAISKDARGIGLGEILLKTNIEIAKKVLKPKNLFLTVYSPNKPAKALYKKLGFKEFAKFKNWIKQGKKYEDMIFMKLNRI